MHKVQEVAALLGVSRVTIYKKLDLLKKELHGKHRKVNGVLCLDEEAIGIIRANLSNDHIRRASGGPLAAAMEELSMNDTFQRMVLENENLTREKSDLLERLRVSEQKTKHYKNALAKTMGMIDILKKDHRDALTLMDEILDGQLQSKKRELDDKNRIITGYKQIIGYNKERISIIEEKLYTLFK